MGWEIVLLSSLAPAIMDAFKHLATGLTRRWSGVSIDDEIKIAKSDVERLTALAQLDTPVGTPSQWIVDLRAAFRYVAAVMLILGGLALVWAGVKIEDHTLVTNGLGLAAAPFSFIFGERLYLPMMGKAK